MIGENPSKNILILIIKITCKLISERKPIIAVIGTNGIPSKYGGFETLANYLTLFLKDAYKFIVYCSNIHDKSAPTEHNQASLVRLPISANGWQSIIYDSISIIHAFFKCDILLVLGPTSAGFLLLLNKFLKKIVVNYGGAEWKEKCILNSFKILQL